MRVAVATCLNLPEPDPDEPLLLAALRSRGIEADVVAWDDPAQHMNACDACVIRSTWNYYRKIDAFSHWFDQTAARIPLFNPPRVFHWNKHKSYLSELQRLGAPTVPTVFVPRGKSAATLDGLGWSDIVIKPAISAGSFRTHRFTNDRLADAQQTLDELTADRDAMIQPFLDGVAREGERSLIWIDGEFTHAIHKHPRFVGQDERVELAEFDARLRAAGDRVIEAVKRLTAFALRDLLYVRVDLMPGAEGEWLLSELEVIEPSLFFLEYPPALDRFVTALHRRLR